MLNALSLNNSHCLDRNQFIHRQLVIRLARSTNNELRKPVEPSQTEEGGKANFQIQQQEGRKGESPLQAEAPLPWISGTKKTSLLSSLALPRTGHLPSVE